MNRLFFFLLIAALNAVAQTATQFEGKTIQSIEFAPAPLLDPVDLSKSQPIRMGEPLRAEKVADAIDSLFATGRFEDISVEAEPSGTGVALRFVVKPRRFVGGVRIDGKIVAPPNRGELHSFTQFSLGAPFQDSDVTDASGRLKKLFENNGLYRATIEPKVETVPDSQDVFISIRVKGGKREKYEHPIIEGETLLSDDVVLRATGWRIPLVHLWKRATSARTSGGVRGLLAKYQSQDRLMARVELQEVEHDEANKRVRPHLSVEPGPKVEVKAQEVKVSKRVLKRYVPIYQERSVDPELLLEGKRNLEEYFQSQGYYDAEVEFRMEPRQQDLQTIDYAISRGTRQKVVKVNIAGNKYFDQDTLRERMFIQPAAFNLRHGRYSEAFRRKDISNISELYKSNGFRDVKVNIAVANDYQGKTGAVGVNVTVEEGPQWLVEHVSLNGFSQMKPEEFEGKLASVPGQPFAEVNLASDRDTLTSRYFEQGYPSAAVTAKWAPSGQPNRVEVVYSAVEGERQYVRNVIVTGAGRTRNNFIDKHITLKAGDPLSPTQQTAIQKSFYDLGIFARVETAIENPDGAETRKNVLYNFEEGDRYRLNFGFGAQLARFGTPSNTSLSSPGGSTGFSPQISLEVSRLNFLGRGHTVSLRTAYSNIEKSGSISYLQPRFRNVEGRNVSYTLLYNDSLDVRTFSSKRQEATVQLSQIFSKSLTGLFGFSYRRVSVSNVIIPVLLVPQFVQPVRLGVLRANLIQDRRNDRSNPSRGIYNTLDLGLADRWFGSQRNFGRVLVRNATYHQLSKHLILARQTQFGILAPFSVGQGLTSREAVPLPERFFGGGADSLRAFPYNQAGPRDTGAALTTTGPESKATGFPLGGNALLFNNVELRFPLLGENIAGVVFHDMGNVYSTIGNLSFRMSQRDLKDFDYAVHAAGFGIRYRTPVGPIRADLAYSINPPSYNGFGGTPAELLKCTPNANPATEPSYCQSTKQNIGHLQFFFSIGQTF